MGRIMESLDDLERSTLAIRRLLVAFRELGGPR